MADNPERSLWCAVISAAILDASWCPLRPTETHELHKQQAFNWLTGNSADFRLVCELADLEPEKVRAFALKEIEEADKKHAARLAKRNASKPELEDVA